MNLSRQLGLALLTAAAAAVVTACGGGGSSGTAAPVTLSVGGTAATGAAIAAGTVTLKCVSGTSTAVTTGVDGSFTIDVGSVTLPCVGRVDYKDAAGVAQKLQTFIATAGTANITPITELIVANLTGGTAVDAFDKFDATKAKAITAAQLTAAIAAIKAYFVTLGLAVTDFPADPIGTKFVAKNGTTAGDKTDALLDALAAKLLSSGLTLSNAVTAVATSGTTAVGGITGVGCTDKVAAFFLKNKGTYPTTADIYTPGPLGTAAKVAGIADKQSTTLVVSESCTVTVGTTVFAYKDNSYSSYPDGQVNIEITASGFGLAGYEVFGKGGSLASICDNTTQACGNFFTK